MFRPDSHTRYCVLQWVPLRRARGYWLRIGTGYRSVDGAIDAICEPLVISRHLRLIEIAPGDPDELMTPSSSPGIAASDPPLSNSACRSARPRQMPRLAQMERAR